MDTEIRQEGMDDISEKGIAVYCDERIAFIDDMHKLKEISPIDNPVKTELLLVTVCLEGRASIYLDGESFSIGRHDLLLCRPNIIIEKSMVSMDLDFRCMCLAPEYLRHLTLISRDSWNILKFLDKSPVIHLTEGEIRQFCQYYDLIRAKLMSPPFRHQKEVVDALLVAFLYDFFNVLDRFIQLAPPSYSSGEKLFQRFLALLTSLSPKPRMVSAYAEQLCVTAKYLTSICKKYSGYTTSELIDQYVNTDIQYLLKKSDMSIKEISAQLDFPNISFFGKYVRKHFGLSPKNYREQLQKADK